MDFGENGKGRVRNHENAQMDLAVFVGTVSGSNQQLWRGCQLWNFFRYNACAGNFTGLSAGGIFSA